MQKELTIFIVDDHELFRDGTTSLIVEIADASSEQNAGTGQINAALQELNSLTQKNAQSAEEMAYSAGNLSSQAIRLKELTRYFNTGKAVTSHSR